MNVGRGFGVWRDMHCAHAERKHFRLRLSSSKKAAFCCAISTAENVRMPVAWLGDILGIFGAVDGVKHMIQPGFLQTRWAQSTGELVKTRCRPGKAAMVSKLGRG